MVCDRCKLVVSDLFQKLGVEFRIVELGRVEMMEGQPTRYLLELLNPAGQLVYQEDMSQGSATIPVRDNGLYLLRLSNEKIALTKKLLLE